MTPAEPAPHRLHALCPYFAMFPPSFARENILQHTKPGDVVFDGFSGRGTTLLAALLNDRAALASDVNPVAYCVTAAKARRPNEARALDLIDRLEAGYERSSPVGLELARRTLPPFFHRAFSPETLRQLLYLRRRLRWRQDEDDCFVMALLLGHLHGESERSPSFCSNQMPHSISTKPAYSLEYWRERQLYAPHKDVFDLLADRAQYRLRDGAPERRGVVRQCDAREVRRVFRTYRGRVAAVITSPPYLDTTCFEEDQWLRRWMLGGPSLPTYDRLSQDDRHRSAASYWPFLQETWRGLAPLLRYGAVIVCRLGATRTSADELVAKFRASVAAVWPSAEALVKPRLTKLRNRQTAVLLPKSIGCRYEVDFTVWVPDPTPTRRRQR